MQHDFTFINNIALFHYNFQNALKEVWLYRKGNYEIYGSSNDDDIIVEIQPWTGGIVCYSIYGTVSQKFQLFCGKSFALECS